MKTDVSETSLEDIICESLVDDAGYRLGESGDYLPVEAVDWAKLHEFLLKTQPIPVGRLSLNTETGRRKFLDRLGHEIQTRGIIDVLRKGVNCYPVHITLMYPLPTVERLSLEGADEQNAKLECESAILNLVVASLKDSTELYKSFLSDESFKLWLKNWVFEDAKTLVRTRLGANFEQSRDSLPRGTLIERDLG